MGAGAQPGRDAAAADLRSRFGPADLRQRRRRACRPCRVNRVGYCNWSRSRASDFASSRDTCICEMPTRSAICVCVIDSKNRSSSTVRSRSGSAASKGRNASRFSIWSRPSVDVAERVGDRGRIVVAAAAAAVDRQRVVGAARDQALDHLVAVHLELRGEFRRGGRAAEPLRQVGRRGAQPQVQFLEPARHLDRPAVVAEVPANLAHDGRHRERHEVRPGVDVEPDHRVDQTRPAPPAPGRRGVRRGRRTGGRCGRPAAGSARRSGRAGAGTAPSPRRSSCEFTEHVGDVGVFRVRS